MRPRKRTKTPIALCHDPASPIGRVTRAEYILNGWGLPHRGMRVIGSYSIVYLLAGAGVYEIAPGRRYPVRAGDLLLVSPGVPHWYGNRDGTRWDELFVLFDGPVFDLLARGGVLDPAKPIVHLEPIEHWRSQFEAALGGGDMRSIPPLIAASRLQSVLAAAFARGVVSAGDGPRLAWVEEACGLLTDPAASAVPVPEIAVRLGLSYESFRKRFTHAVGVSPAQYRAPHHPPRAGADPGRRAHEPRTRGPTRILRRIPLLAALQAGRGHLPAHVPARSQRAAIVPAARRCRPQHESRERRVGNRLDSIPNVGIPVLPPSTMAPRCLEVAMGPAAPHCATAAVPCVAVSHAD